MDKDYPAYLETAAKAARLRHDQRELAIVNAEEKGFARGQRQGMFESMLEEQQKLYAEGHLPAYELAVNLWISGQQGEGAGVSPEGLRPSRIRADLYPQ